MQGLFICQILDVHIASFVMVLQLFLDTLVHYITRFYIIILLDMPYDTCEYFELTHAGY